MAWMLSCCGSGVGWQLQLQLDPLSWEPPHATGAALEKAKRQKDEKKKILQLQKGAGSGRGRNRLRVWDWQVHNEVYGMTGQWGPAVQHGKLYPIFCGDLCGKRI